MRNLMLLAAVLALFGVLFYFLGGPSDPVASVVASQPAQVNQTPPPKSRALPPAPQKPMPSLRLSPEPIEALRPPRDHRLNASRELLVLPKNIVRQKQREAAEQHGEAPKATVSKDEVQRAVKVAQSGIKDCFEHALRRDPKLGGTLKVKFTLVAQDGVGRLDDAEIVGGEEDGALNQPFMAMCALKALAKVEYPVPEGEGTITVTYPFRFAPSADEDAE